MSQKNLTFTGHLKKDEGKLVYVNSAAGKQYETFLSHIEEGQFVDVFFDANKDDGTLAQIAKIKASIRGLSTETGETFEDMELKIKKKSGLYFEKEIDGEHWKIVKSFGKCSKEELSLAIQTILDAEQFVYNNPRD